MPVVECRVAVGEVDAPVGPAAFCAGERGRADQLNEWVWVAAQRQKPRSIALNTCVPPQG
jgi:hypothetical protein